jgi:hypothetical protein
MARVDEVPTSMVSTRGVATRDPEESTEDDDAEAGFGDDEAVTELPCF